MGRHSEVMISKNVHFRSLYCAKGEQPRNGLKVKKNKSKEKSDNNQFFNIA
jgi:hypothetical protein